MFKKRNKRIRRSIKFLIFFSLFIAFVIFVDSSLSNVVGPLAIKNAEELINNKVNTVVNDALNDLNLSYDNLIFTGKNGNEVSYVQANAVEINKLKSRVVKNTDKLLDSKKNLETIIQIGSIINSSFLSNRGPTVCVYLDLFCSTNAEITSEFVSAGLNQTLHIIKLNVTTDFCLMIINDQYFDKIINDYIIAESVIVGDVPSAYGSIYGLTNER